MRSVKGKSIVHSRTTRKQLFWDLNLEDATPKVRPGRGHHLLHIITGLWHCAADFWRPDKTWIIHSLGVLQEKEAAAKKRLHY